MAKQKNAISPTREENYPEWYQQVVRAADLAENTPVRGCMVIKPYGYAIWEKMQAELELAREKMRMEAALHASLPGGGGDLGGSVRMGGKIGEEAHHARTFFYSRHRDGTGNRRIRRHALGQ